MNWMTTTTAAVITAVALAGCQGPEGEQTTPGSQSQDEDGSDVGGVDDVDDGVDVGDAGDVTDAPDSGDEPEVVDLEGSWVKLIVTSSFTETLMGGEEESLTVSVQRVDVDQDGQDVTLNTEACSVEILEESDLASTTIPESFVKSLEPEQRPAQIADGRFQVPENVQVRGVEFEDGQDPKTEPLPDDADDPRVFDQNGDGNPGMTVEVDAGIVSGEIYVAQRVIDSMEADQVDDDEIVGIVDWQQDQEILGASDDTLLMAEPQTRPNPDEEASYFHMIRLDGAEADDCATLADERDEWFDVDAP